LIIEVADTSLREDRIDKGRVYARARIPVYWIVNLQNLCLEVYTRPKAGKSPAYRQCQNFGRKDLVPVLIEDRVVGTIPIRELLP